MAGPVSSRLMAAVGLADEEAAEAAAAGGEAAEGAAAAEDMQVRGAQALHHPPPVWSADVTTWCSYWCVLDSTLC